MSIKPVGYVSTGTPEEIKAAYERTRQSLDAMCVKTLPEYKLIVAGGRDFDNAELMSRVLYAMSDVEFADKAISIVSGMAKGADALAYMFAHKLDIKCYEFHAQWKRYGAAAGPIRNKEMGNFADGLLAFHDGKSVGTAGMIRYMQSLGKPVTVINY